LQHVIVHAQPLLQGMEGEGAELVVDARGRRRSSAASSVDEYREPPKGGE